MKFIEIPDSVKNISYGAFESCQGITSVKVEATTPPTAGDYMFLGCSKLTEILVISASVDAYKNVIDWTIYASKIEGF